MNSTRFLNLVQKVSVLFKPQEIKDILGVSRDKSREMVYSYEELIALFIYFHTYKYEDFLDFYNKNNFKIGYERLIYWQRRLYPVFQTILDKIIQQNLKHFTKYHIVDSTPIPWCKTIRQYNTRKRLNSPELAAGYSTIEDRFFGLKLHIMTNAENEIISYSITSGNTDDRTPIKGSFLINLRNALLKNKQKTVLLADAGYRMNKLQSSLFKMGITPLFKPKTTDIKQFTKPQRKFYKKRQRIETTIGQLKKLKIVYNFSRSLQAFKTHILLGLISYNFKKC